MDSHSFENGKPGSEDTHHQQSNQLQQEQLQRKEELVLISLFQLLCKLFILEIGNLLIFEQSSSPFPVNPSTQTQVIVLSGKVSYTLHTAFVTQGLNSVQGFLHSPRPPWMMQASWLGQSLSILQPSSTTGSGTLKRRIDVYCRFALLKAMLQNQKKYILGVQATPYGSPV